MRVIVQNQKNLAVNFQTIILLCFLLIFSYTTDAQDRWIEGKVVFSQDSSFTGHFKFRKHVEKEIIAIKNDSRLLALPPKDILSAEGVIDGELKKWKTKEFSHEKTSFNVHLFLEEVYAGKRYQLYKKDLSFIRWSPYSDIVCDALAFDSYKHLMNQDVLLLKEIETEKMVVINRPNTWNTNKYVINKNILCEYLNADKKQLKELIKENDLKLDNLTDIVTLFMILDDSRSRHLSYSGH